METLNDVEQLGKIPGPHHIAIGVFDGLHLGHKAVIGEALRAADREGGSSVVATFDPHPSRILHPENPRRLLASLEHKKRLIEAMAVDCLLVMEFDRAVAELRPREFLSRIMDASGNLATICVGHDWRFGNNREGGVEFLRKAGSENGFRVVAVEPVRCRDSQPVSSTRIRLAVQNGDFKTASNLLGREYTLLGRVIEGDRLGGKIGFPTANLTVFNEELPPDGVYAVEVDLDGRTITGAGNLGVRPTVTEPEARRRLEIHLFDFSEDIYGHLLEVRFRGFIRPEQKFDGIDELKAQIARDVERAHELLGE